MSELQAEKATAAALGWDGEGECPPGEWQECSGLVEELSEAFFELAVVGTRRVARLCGSAQGLACWALELLEEQACQVTATTSGQG